MKKTKSTGLEIALKGKRFILINYRGGYQELDITPVFHFLKDFFKGTWKKKKIRNSCYVKSPIE